MPLEDYRRKRNFAQTPEPAGGPAVDTAATGRFVVQRHRATRLHYDFRLEIGGVLVSWAVPKGPTLDAGARRMAVHVEDHPIEYLDFEGVIPKKQYGAGDVIVWDWGTWRAEAETPDPEAAIRAGELKFSLDGQKVRGRFTIVRTSGRGRSSAFESDESEQWLLIHKRDGLEVGGWDAEDHPQSVKTGRTNDEVRDQRDALWVSEAPATVAEIDLSAAVTAPMPRFVEPMAATLTDRSFTHDDWLFEVKWDGYRLQAVINAGALRTFTRNGKDGETFFPGLLVPPTWIEARQAIVDGEVVALDGAGRPDFGLLQERLGGKAGVGIAGAGTAVGTAGLGTGKSGAAETGASGSHGASPAEPATLVYQAFDLLYLDGRSLLKVQLEDRKRLLQSILRPDRRVRYSGHVEREGVAFLEAVREQQLEGAIAKHRNSVYEPGKRSKAWLKLKVRPAQELVVGGWTPGAGSTTDLGALVVGYFEEDDAGQSAGVETAGIGQRRLRFAGKVGSGFTARARADLLRRLAVLRTEAPPFEPPPPANYRGRWGGDLANVSWVRPELVIQAELGGWSRDGLVRQAAFKGIEEGRNPLDVIREVAVGSSEAVRAGTQIAPGAARRGEASRGSASRYGASRGSARPADGSGAAGGDTGQVRSALEPPAPGHAPSEPVGESAHVRPWSATPQELAVLDAMGREGPWLVGGVELKLTNLDKPIFPPLPGDGSGPVTKRELVRYFALVAPVMLSHLADRPLNLHRFPDGADKPGFWQKDLRPTDPAWLRRWREVGVEARDANEHVVADGVATLCWLANQAAFEVHAWTSRLDAPYRPTFALIDIDPGSATTWEETLVLARLFRTALEHLAVRGYPKVTGQRGVQIWIPITPRYDHGQTTTWVERLSRAVGAAVPELVSWEWAKGARGGKARLDYTQNASIKTLVAPYAVRPAPGGPVSAPITWDELDDPALRPDRWGVRTMQERVDAVGDLFAGAQTDLQDLPPV